MSNFSTSWTVARQVTLSSTISQSLCKFMSFELLACTWIISVWCLCAKLLQSCLTLCDPRDSSPLGPSVHGILQARILEWVAMPSSRECSQPRDKTCISSPRPEGGPSKPQQTPGDLCSSSGEVLAFPSQGRLCRAACSVMSDSLWPHALWPARPLCPWNSPGSNSGLGCYSLIQGIFLTQGSNLGLPHFRQTLPPEPPRKS